MAARGGASAPQAVAGSPKQAARLLRCFDRRACSETVLKELLRSLRVLHTNGGYLLHDYFTNR